MLLWFSNLQMLGFLSLLMMKAPVSAHLGSIGGKAPVRALVLLHEDGKTRPGDEHGRDAGHGQNLASCTVSTP